jgi:hypothetical protein
LTAKKKRRENNQFCQAEAASIKKKKKRTMALQTGVSTSKVLILVGAGLSLSLSRPFFAFSDYISFNFTLTPMLFGCFTIVDPINNSNTSQSAISPSFVFSLEI